MTRDRSSTRGRATALLLALAMVAAACSGAKDDTSASDVRSGTSTTLNDDGFAVGAPDGFTADGEDGTGDGAGSDATGSDPSAPVGSSSDGGTEAPAPTDGGGGTPPPDGGGTAPAGAGLYSGADATRGITDDSISICGHAALTYGPAFNATSDDFNVYYSAVNDAGGVHGRKIHATYTNDNYDPATAIEAAEECRARKPFMILGGIGFDQIPGVRNWAETNKELYFHHIATVKGTEGKRYSYTTQPTVERVGQAFAQLIAARYSDKKIGVLYRNSEFWDPGFVAFREVAEARGLDVVLSVPVEKNQGNYTQALISLRDAGAEVVWGWENTLALTQMVSQAKAQRYSPQWVAFPFNLTSQTLGDDALEPPMVGLASWPGFSKGDYTGTFAAYADDMREFEAQYAKYRPNTDIGGVAGDLLWLNWVEQKRLVALLQACGRDCDRDRLVGLLVNGYKATTSPTCQLDFSGGRHDGSGGLVNVMETYKAPSGKVNWRSTTRCVG
ncbi:MAG TPA: ABC transporter substrate-binding protein [Acidimicrobiales bacterium]|nr:ABC transporter substrate-binding protein [Acidimicrobiales bacterium]